MTTVGYPCGGGFRHCNGEGGGGGRLGIGYSLLFEREKRDAKISLLASPYPKHIYGPELRVNPKAKVSLFSQKIHQVTSLDKIGSHFKRLLSTEGTTNG
jgi:hypothetical protein